MYVLNRSLSDNPMYMLKNFKYSSRKVIDMPGWLGIKIICPSGPTYISADCCFSEVALYNKSNKACQSSIKRTSSSSY